MVEAEALLSSTRAFSVRNIRGIWKNLANDILLVSNRTAKQETKRIDHRNSAPSGSATKQSASNRGVLPR
jgi:hypothetical protein